MKYNAEELIPVGEFANLLSTTKATLHHYDNIGVLKPACIGENGYRYYHPDQAQIFLIITLFSDCGLPLRDIQEYLETFDVNHGLALIEEAKERIDVQLRRLTQAKLLIEGKERLYRACENQNYWAPFVQCLPERTYFKSDRLRSDEYQKIHTAHSVNIARHVNKYGEFPEHPFISHSTAKREGARVTLEDFSETSEEVEQCTHPAGIYISILCKGTDYAAEEAVLNLYRYADSNGYTLSNDLYIVDTVNFMITQEPDEYTSMFFMQVISKEGCDNLDELEGIEPSFEMK